jgi:3-oxoacyl-[acyl-carrier-protein] synthase III
VSTGVIAGVGTALPEVRVTTDRLAGERGPEAVRLLREVGFEAKHQPVDDVSPWHLATEAARRALSAAQVEAQDVDLVLTVGLPRGEYRTWALSLAVQNALGMTRAAGLDLGDTTGGSLLAGLRVLKAKFAVDARRQIALLLLPHRFSDMVDLTRPGDRWLWPLGDGGVALVVKREGDGWAPLAAADRPVRRGRRRPLPGGVLREGVGAHQVVHPARSGPMVRRLPRASRAAPARGHP